MAVRHLKRYASWVQTVQQLIVESVIERFEPRGKCYVRGDVWCDKRQLTAVAYRNIGVSKSNDIGGIPLMQRDNTEGSL